MDDCGFFLDALQSPFALTPFLFEVARAIRGDRRVFGGIQLVVTGDFLQLPPVSSGESRRRFCFQVRDFALVSIPRRFRPLMRDLVHWTRRERVDVVARDCLQSNAWQRAISRVIVLDEVRRQDDARFVRILQDIRFGRSVRGTLVDLQFESLLVNRRARR